MEFTANDEDSHLLINSVCATAKSNTGNQCSNFILENQLIAELNYFVSIFHEFDLSMREKNKI